MNPKVWGGNRTWRGAATQGRILSALPTAQQNGIDAINHLAALARAPNPAATPRSNPDPRLRSAQPFTQIHPSAPRY